MDEFPEIRIPGEKESERIAEEVNLVIKDRVHELGVKKRLNQRLKDHLEEKLLRMPHRTYLWVYLVFEYLDTHSFEKRTTSIDRIIDNFPTGLNSVYENLLLRSENRYMARKAFCIILAATRPLNVQEMNIAVHVDKSSTDLDDLESNEDFEITLRNWCGLLVSINADKVYLLHQTTREYLLQAGLSGCADGQDGPITMQEAHAVLAFSCIGFLELAQQKPEFLDYSINNWTTHTRDSSLNRDRSLSPRLEKLCDPHEGTAGRWIPHYQGQEDCQFSYPWQNIDLEHINTLWIASAFGMTAPVEQILRRGEVNDVVDRFERNAVLMAAHGGHDSVLKLLVDSNQFDVNCRDFWELIALSFAVMLGGLASVKVLLDCGKLDLGPKELIVPFQSAIESGDEEVLRLLLCSEKVSDIDFRSPKGDTPLIMACRIGNKGIVNLVLDSGKANLNLRGSGGSTALAVATREEQEGIVRLLLGTKTVDANAPDDNGWTAFLRAADTRNVTIIQLFIDSGKVDYTKKLNDDSTALHLAVQNNSVDAVKALLPVTVQVDALDDEQCTPLIYAAWNGYENVTRLLLESGGVDVNLSGGVSDTTPLSLARSSGHDDIVKLLLEFGAIDD
ncbi:ankyrin repeat domain-containing protein [Aspergillus melleus]|uniref:ankyrin repeat domain-containing protein n=1 Tax=Aspergillus melleus TaxID=138277 RepID=UPI001E8E0C0A|nr:uncharacterized protein LDX57_007025 [Aspergillus melleus]KAH8429361.1 hypothetical protein LDX57_007025 [Aspergillus melleus]